MIKKLHWLLPLVFLAACNNDKTKEKSNPMPAAETPGKGYCDSVNAGLIAEDNLKGSPHRTAMATVNGSHIHIEYNSPGVRGRTIWGGLVAYDKVWATGAHDATSIQFGKDVEIGSKKVNAGKYGLFTIPGKEKWVFILNTRYDQHMADKYKEKEDVLRIDVKPEEHAMTQRLTYLVNKLSDTTGEIRMEWERLSIVVPFTVL